MASDLDKPLLRLQQWSESDRKKGKPPKVPALSGFERQQQIERFGPKFDRLRQVLDRDPSGLMLRGDATALSPERLLVFELRGAVSAFAAAIRKVKGLELIDEEELGDDDDKAPVAYLMVPDMQALREIEGLWQRWLREEKFPKGFTPWRDVFELLRDLRPWGPSDRVQQHDRDILEVTVRPALIA